MRNSTIDIAKGIGILTVVLCHNWILYDHRGELSRVVFSFHMPLFFFISGIFFKPNQPFKQLLVSKVNTLLKPFFVVLFLVTIANYIFNPSTNLTKEILGIFYASGSTITWTPLWFLSHLFSIFIFAWLINTYLLSKLKNNILKAVILLLMLLFGVHYIDFFWNMPIKAFLFNDLINSTSAESIGLPFNLDIILVTSTFFIAGHLLAKKIFEFKFNLLLTILALIVFTALHYLFNQTLELNAREYGNFLICTLQIITGIYLVFALSSLCTHSARLTKCLSYLGIGSLFILIFHFYPQHWLTGTLHYYFPNYQLLTAAFSMIASILLSMFIWELTQRCNWLQKLLLARK
jgi:polysaccharide biosynthesis protein PslL